MSHEPIIIESLKAPLIGKVKVWHALVVVAGVAGALIFL